MIKKITLSFFALLTGLILYLCFWPVPIKAVAWEAPVNKGYTDAFTPNMKLAGLKRLSIGEHHGPEDVAGRYENGRMTVYVSTQSGDILRIDPITDRHTVVANTGGVALGLQFRKDGALIVADAHKGLLVVDVETGAITVLTNTAEDGSPLLFADEMDIAADGKIYLSDASTKFGAAAAGTTLQGSLLELLEHGKTGRIVVYDPKDNTTKIIATGLSFPNGIAMCPTDDCILFAETGMYSVSRLWVKGPKTGTIEPVLENLPGFPDNINRGQNGRYWVGLTSPRSKAMDDVSGKPFLRELSLRLPKFMQVGAENYGFIIAFDDSGKILAQYQDPSGAYPLTTGATEPGDGWLYIGSLGAEYLGRKDLSNERFK